MGMFMKVLIFENICMVVKDLCVVYLENGVFVN